MAIIVQKYGGSSLQTTERITHIADRIVREQKKGNQLVVVVSAMGDETDRLVQLSHSVSCFAKGRENDLLLSAGEQMSSALMALALKERGAEAVALTGSQAGIEAEPVHGDARITAIHSNRIEQELREGKVAVVAGFQGANEGEVFTLGRGGSDTTAAALAAALKADRCDIFTDVEGVYSADPRIIPGAKKQTAMDYDSLLTMAELGAGVIHPRAVEHAKKYHVPLVVRSSFSDEEGTWIHNQSASPSVIGITYQEDLCHLHLTGHVRKESLLSEIDDSMVIGTRYKSGEVVLIIKEEDVELTLSWLKTYKETFGIHAIQTVTSMVAVHLVFANKEEKNRLEPLLKGAKFSSLEDAISFESNPAVWSLSIAGERGVEVARMVYDRYIACHDKRISIAY